MNIIISFISRSEVLCILLVLQMMVASIVGLPVHQRHTTSSDDAAEPARRRFSRKVGNLNITSSPEQYVRELYDNYVSESNTRTAANRATDVWCFPDKDVAKEIFRPKPVRTSKCTAYTQYLFQWSSIVDEIQDSELTIRRSILRAYTQIINRHIGQNETISVNLTVTMIPRNNNETTNISDWSEGVYAGQHNLTIAQGSGGWIELNVTEGAEVVWPLMKNFTEVQVIIKAEVNCANQKKIPFNFINPAEISLEHENRRLRHLDIQPFLVIFADNKETRALLQQETEEVATGQGEESNSTFPDIGDMLFPSSAPSKRSSDLADDSPCSLSTFVVNLHELGLTNVQAPLELNISKCSGGCTDRLTVNRLGTNHAKIMASIYNREQLELQSNPDYEVTATPPCCVPTTYSVVTFLISTLDGTATGLKSHNHLRATACGCR